MVTPRELLQVLPPFTNSSLLIEGNQNVPDIIREVLEAHSYFSGDYDFIYQYFDKGSIENTCRLLFDFCKRNIAYKIEGEKNQTTKSPSALISMGHGDCKHYAGFIAGVLCAITRNTGKNIKWAYRFGSYSLFDREPGHVFVVAKDAGQEIWIDPVLSYFDERLQPTYFIDKKVSMPLYRLSGFAQENTVSAITAEIKLPDYVNLLVGKFEFVKNETDILDNKKIVAIAKSKFDSYQPTIKDDNALKYFLLWLKVSVMDKFGILVKPLWDGGPDHLSNKWQYDFAPWIKLYYPNAWQSYLDAWNEYRKYWIGVIYENWAPIINKGSQLIEKLIQDYTGISITTSLLPASLTPVPVSNTPLPGSTQEPVNNNLLWPLLITGGVYFLTNNKMYAAIAGVGSFFMIDKNKNETTAAPTTTAPAITKPATNLPQIDFSKLFPI